MIASYINPTILKPEMTSKLAEEIIADKDTDWGKSSKVEWVNSYPSIHQEIIEVNKTTIVNQMSGEGQIERARKDFIANFNNYSKYPKMNEEDWK